LTVIRVQGRADGVERVAHALAALRHRLVGETDDVEHRLAGGHQHLHVDRNGLDALKGDGGDARDHAAVPQAE
jgi:hypothetical protein